MVQNNTNKINERKDIFNIPIPVFRELENYFYQPCEENCNETYKNEINVNIFFSSFFVKIPYFSYYFVEIIFLINFFNVFQFWLFLIVKSNLENFILFYFYFI